MLSTKSVHNGHTDVVNILVFARAGVNIQSNYGFCPLHVASILGFFDTVKLLMDNLAQTEKETYVVIHMYFVAAFNGH